MENYLFHFTSLNALKNILESDTFYTSDFEKANDYKEKYVCLNKDDISKYRYISFEKDELLYQSFSNPAMWYHYADKHKGVCLQIDPEIFNSLCKPIISYFIEYKDGVSYIDKQSNILDYLKYKRSKWSYESEYRYIFDSVIKEIIGFNECIDSIYFGAEVEDQTINEVINCNDYILQAFENRTLHIYKMYVDKEDGRLNRLDYYSYSMILKNSHEN